MTEQSFFSIIDYSYPSALDPQVVAGRFAAIQREWVAMYPGFQSARFLASTEGTVVRAIVEWASYSAFEDFERVSDTQGRVAALQKAFAELEVSGARQTFRFLMEQASVQRHEPTDTPS